MRFFADESTARNIKRETLLFIIIIVDKRHLPTSISVETVKTAITTMTLLLPTYTRTRLAPYRSAVFNDRVRC